MIDPLGRPTVTAISDHCVRTCRPTVRQSVTTFQKSNKTKQISSENKCSLLARLWVWPSGSFIYTVSVILFHFHWFKNNIYLNYNDITYICLFPILQKGFISYNKFKKYITCSVLNIIANHYKASFYNKSLAYEL